MKEKKSNRLKEKKGFLTRDIIITGLLFTGIVAIFILAITDISVIYNNNNLVNDEFSTNYNKLTEIADNAEIARIASQSEKGLSFIGTFDVIFSGTFTVVKMVFSTIGLYGDITANFVSDFTFLDSSVIKLLFLIGLSIITTVVVFTWISSISKGKL